MNIALILSGGSGTRIGGDIPKQYQMVNGRTLLSFCLETLLMHDMIDGIQIVADQRWHNKIRNEMKKMEAGNKFRGFSKPGQNRQMSIFHGIKDIKSYVDAENTVLIHDAARPCLSAQLIQDCFYGLEGHDGVMPVLPVKDTVYVSKDGRRVWNMLERSQLFAGQAPELFRLEPYYEANCRLQPEEMLAINGSTEPAVLAGLDVVMIPGDERNFKITTPEDLKYFRERIRKGTTL